MASVFIGYDLNKEKNDRGGYAKLIVAIESLSGTRWHCLDSTWIIKTSLTPVQVRDRLGPHIDSDDELLVAIIDKPAAWKGFNSECSDWLLKNL